RGEMVLEVGESDLARQDVLDDQTDIQRQPVRPVDDGLDGGVCQRFTGRLVAAKQVVLERAGLIEHHRPDIDRVHLVVTTWEYGRAAIRRKYARQSALLPPGAAPHDVRAGHLEWQLWKVWVRRYELIEPVDHEQDFGGAAIPPAHDSEDFLEQLAELV